MTPDPRDHVDAIVAQWQRACPSIDVKPIGITGRVTRIALYLERDIQHYLQRFWLTPSGFEVLLALHAAPARQLSPTTLARTRRMSSAGITGLLDDLASLGLVTRSPNPLDRRGAVISLTRRGSETLRSAALGWHAQQVRISSSLDTVSTDLLDQLLTGLLRPDDLALNGSRGETSWFLSRLASHINSDADALFAPYGISHGGFQVLASLYRAGPPFRRSPSRVARGLMLSAAGLTGRMAQLERVGLLRRERDPADRRRVIVQLTASGRRLIQRVFPVFVSSHAQMLDPILEENALAALAGLLRRVLLDFESRRPTNRPES
ncbi:MAG TPA: MarR family transcriptional regulator [Candidatus Dormibacteraeota bacterium]|nr:MarR family transcriptional regulator [Candidatus Dormibacteraeota bacterium]